MQQLSLFLDLSSSEPINTTWFQDILAILRVRQEPAWTDNFGKSLRQWLMEQGHTPIKTLSLFSGGGGLDIGFHDAGFEIIQMVELEAKYVQTLQQIQQIQYGQLKRREDNIPGLSVGEIGNYRLQS